MNDLTRDPAPKRPGIDRLRRLTERTAELEWLFRVTTRLAGAADDRLALKELLAQVGTRMGCAFSVMYVPEKRLTLTVEHDPVAARALQDAWQQTQPHLMVWVQRRGRPLAVNHAGGRLNAHARCKVLCVPVVRESGRVLGFMAFYNPPAAADFSRRHVFVARHIGRQAANIVAAQFDLITGLYTRDGLDQMAGALGEGAELEERSVLYLDIDHMHVVNELHGFDLGNELIVRVAELLSEPLLPSGALAARITADRFAVVLPRTSPSAAVAVAKSLQSAASQLLIGPVEKTFEVSLSCGVAALLPMTDGLSRAIASAEIACKVAKVRGRDRVEVYAFEDGRMMRRHRDTLAVAQLRAALKDDRLVLYAQRIHPLQDAAHPGGYEVLLRVQETDGSLAQPGPLIEAAKRYQLLPSIDRWVVRRALQMLAPYRGVLRTRELGMSLNVSGQSMGDEVFARQFIQLLKEARLPRDCISVELTEQAAITNLPRANEMIKRLDGLGCRFALDDFGTGSNSLHYLKELTVYRVKIDGAFVRDVLTNRNSRATVRGIVELAQGMGIETVAEYVETQEIAQEMRSLGVTYAQGFAFGKPAPLGEILESLAQEESQRLSRLFLES